jgi:hypothetical protein
VRRVSVLTCFLALFLFLKHTTMFTFENLEVYKKAFAQNQKVYRLLEKDTSLPRYMKDQLGRASLSIQLNIAEGSGRFAKRDRRNFFVVARSSALECASLDTVSICGR